MKKSCLAAWTAAHFTVDFACFVLLFGALKPACGDLQALAGWFLTYNVVAFGLQPLIGCACDKRPALRGGVGLLGVALTALGLVSAFAVRIFFDGVSPVIASMLIAAAGNAAFHVDGGADILVKSRGKMSPNGVFVASGALGVSLGTMLGGTAPVRTFPLALSLLVLAEAGLTAAVLRGAREGTPGRRTDLPIVRKRPFGILVGLLFFAVAIRAYVGAVIPLDWERTGLLVLLPSCAALLGKALGGVLGDRLGPGRTGVGSLLLALPLICFGATSPVLSLLGVALFNTAMPLTLCAMAGTMPDYPGFAFGLTTLALLLGSAVTYFWAAPAGLLRPLIAALILAAACAVAVAIKSKREDMK